MQRVQLCAHSKENRNCPWLSRSGGRGEKPRPDCASCRLESFVVEPATVSSRRRRRGSPRSVPRAAAGRAPATRISFAGFPSAFASARMLSPIVCDRSTTPPSNLTVPRKLRVASTAAPSAAFLCPRPIYGVARTSSIARFRSGWLKMSLVEFASTFFFRAWASWLLGIHEEAHA